VTLAKTHERNPRHPLRLWPGVVAVVLQWLVRFVLPVAAPDAAMFGVLGAIALGFVVVVWWLFFSRAPWSERVGAIALMVVALAATSRVVHESVANGMMGMMLPIHAIPVLSLALVAWAAASRGLSTGRRRAALVASILLACGVFTLLRTDGITGDGASELHFRWTDTAEERLLARAAAEPALVAPTPPGERTPEPSTAATDGRVPAPETSAPALPKASEARTPVHEGEEPMAVAADPAGAKMDGPWPGFRGPARDGVIRGARIATDWSRSAPVELWRRAIGPGWSSFAVSGDLFYTQEQRGDEEIVACHRISTGEQVWRHRDNARFWESNGGAGPRSTPTLGNGRVYTFGATGILNALDAATGGVVWSRNAASDTGVRTPDWGFSSSPLVVGDIVVVAVSGVLAAYDAAAGDQRWVHREPGGGSYSSPHLATIHGVPQILLIAGGGVRSVAPADGTLLWKHAWSGVPIVQPAIVSGGDVLFSTGGMSGALGTRRIAVSHGPGGWTVEERWTSNGLKPYFNDFVVHKGHAYGFDGFILASVDIEDGARKWKGGRYGHGQLALLPDQDLLLVLSEDGELALVSATPDKFTEIARVPALEGKTWNHPVLAGDVLLVRNGQEMAAFRLSLAGR
jgi:outer membrane protein assembly factor BamB